MLIPRCLSGAIVEQGRAGNAQLPTDERKHGLADDFPRLNQTPRVAKGTELEGESEPVLRPSASTDTRQVLGIQDMMLDEYGFVAPRFPWQVEQGGALPASEDDAVGHAISFRDHIRLRCSE